MIQSLGSELEARMKHSSLNVFVVWSFGSQPAVVSRCQSQFLSDIRLQDADRREMDHIEMKDLITGILGIICYFALDSGLGRYKYC